jgi:hypothetical protein
LQKKTLFSLLQVPAQVTRHRVVFFFFSLSSRLSSIPFSLKPERRLLIRGAITMISARNFVAPARQCLRTTRVSPGFASPLSQLRGYASAADDRVAKFKGQKGPDVCHASIDFLITLPFFWPGDIRRCFVEYSTFEQPLSINFGEDENIYKDWV